MSDKFIKIVEIDLDYCRNIFGQYDTNLITYSEDFSHTSWINNYMDFAPNFGENPIDSEETTTKLIAKYGYGHPNRARNIQKVTTLTEVGNYFLKVRAKKLDWATFAVKLRAWGYVSEITNEVTTIFDLDSGTIVSPAVPVDTSITSIDDGFYEIEIEFDVVVPGPVEITFYIDGGDLVYPHTFSDGTKGIEMYGPQLNFGGVEPYQKTTRSSNCSAELSASVPRKCKNTLARCPVKDDYVAEIKTYRYFQNFPYMPTSVDGFPALLDFNVAPASFKDGEALGDGEEVEIILKDFAHHDRGIDQYARERLTGAASFDPEDIYDPQETGTHFGKLRAANLYYINRPVRIWEGKLPWNDRAGSEAQPYFNLSEVFQKLTQRNYFLASMEGPNDGEFRIVAKDILKVIKEDGIKAPSLSLGELSEDIDDAVTEFDLKSGHGDGYPASGIGSIGRETFDFTRAGDTITIVNGRGNYGTEANGHETDDTFQIAYVESGKTVAEILGNLFLNYVKYSPDLLDQSQWATETDEYLPRLYNCIVTKPTDVEDLLDELAEEAGFNLWVDTQTNLIKMIALKAPNAGSVVIDDEDWIVTDSVEVEEITDVRVTQMWTSFGLINPQERLDDMNNYRRTVKAIDTDAESANQYGGEVIRQIFSRWIQGANKPAVDDINSRILSRFRDVIRGVSLKVYADKAPLLSIGQVRFVKTRQIQNEYGEAETIPFRIMSMDRQSEYLSLVLKEQRYIPPGAIEYRLELYNVVLVNLREYYELNYGTPTGAETVVVVVPSDSRVGGLPDGQFSIVVGDWPEGQEIVFTNYGVIQGAGGKGADAVQSRFDPLDGQDGGSAIYTRFPITFDNQGQVISGGGGGCVGHRSVVGPAGYYTLATGGGGGGAGTPPGDGGLASKPDFGGHSGSDGSYIAGGAGGNADYATSGGSGGGPNEDGQTIVHPDLTDIGTGGAKGVAIDGDSYITFVGVGDILGDRIN